MSYKDHVDLITNAQLSVSSILDRDKKMKKIMKSLGKIIEESLKSWQKFSLSSDIPKSKHRVTYRSGLGGVGKTPFQGRKD